MNRMGSWNICCQVCVHRHARAFGLVSWLHTFIRGSLPHINGYVPGFHLWSATSHGQVFLGWIYVYVYVYIYIYICIYICIYIYIIMFCTCFADVCCLCMITSQFKMLKLSVLIMLVCLNPEVRWQITHRKPHCCQWTPRALVSMGGDPEKFFLTIL